MERYQEQMLRLAVSFVPSRAVAEEVVQDTWLGMLRGLDSFEGRSSLKTWLFRILVNRARTTGTHEQRSVPVADPEPAVDPSRFDALRRLGRSARALDRGGRGTHRGGQAGQPDPGADR